VRITSKKRDLVNTFDIHLNTRRKPINQINRRKSLLQKYQDKKKHKPARYSDTGKISSDSDDDTLCGFQLHAGFQCRVGRLSERNSINSAEYGTINKCAGKDRSKLFTCGKCNYSKQLFHRPKLPCHFAEM
jgi:hypothetical protein